MGPDGYRMTKHEAERFIEAMQDRVGSERMQAMTYRR